MSYQTQRRQAWAAADRCRECGRVKEGTLLCEACRVANANRSNRSYWKKRMAHATLKKDLTRVDVMGAVARQPYRITQSGE